MSALITNTGSVSLTFRDRNGTTYEVAGSGTLTLPTAQVVYKELKGALARNAITVSGWRPTNEEATVIENTAANWSSGSVVLADGDIGLETDTGNIKIGNGRDGWAALNYFTGGYNALFSTQKTFLSSGVSMLTLTKTTTNATPGVVTLDGAAVAASNIVTLANNTSAVFKVSVVGRDIATGNTVYSTAVGGVKRVANAASTALIAAVSPTTVADSALSAATVGVTADTTNGGITITVTGISSTTIHWLAMVEIVRVA